MKLKYDFEIMDMGEEYVAVPVGDAAEIIHGTITLNEVSADIFRQLKEETTLEKMHKYLKSKYNESSDDEIGQTLVAFMNKLLNAGLIEDKNLQRNN